MPEWSRVWSAKSKHAGSIPGTLSKNNTMLNTLLEQKYNLCKQVINQVNEPHNIYSRGCSFLGDSVSIPGSTKLVDTLFIEQSSNWMDEIFKDYFDGQVSLAKSFWDAYHHFSDNRGKPLLYANAAMTSSAPRRGSNRAYIIYMTQESWSYIYLDLGRNDDNPEIKRLQEEIQIIEAASTLLNGEGVFINKELALNFIDSLYCNTHKIKGFNEISNKIHLMPGSFNPFHEGHLALVKAIQKEFGVLPSLEMAKIRRGKDTYTTDEYFTKVLNSPLPVYCTWENARLLDKFDYFSKKGKIDKSNFIFHIGSDVLLRLDQDENPKDFEKGTLCVWERAGYPISSEIVKRWKKPVLKYSKVPGHLMKGVDPHISSTKIREQKND